MTKRFAVAALLPLALTTLAAQNPKPPKPQSSPKAGLQTPARAQTTARHFFDAHCTACHDAQTKQGNLDLTALPLDLDDPKTFALWVKIHDRVRDGEMPPPKMETLPVQTRNPFLTAIAAPMIAADDSRARQNGRAAWRRMNRYEYENTLRDLLQTPWLQIKDMLPEDGQAARFNKVGDALDVSHVQMSRYLSAADYALREAMVQQATRPQTTTQRFYARDQRSFTGPAKFTFFNGSPERATFPIIGNAPDIAVLDEKAPMTVGDKDPARREQESVGVVASAYEPIEPKFNQFRAPQSGRYKLRLCAHSFWAGPESAEKWWRPSQKKVSAGRTREPITLYAETPPRQLRKLGNFDIGPEPTVSELQVTLLKGETIRPDAVRLFRSRPPAFRNPLATPEGQPGVTFQWLEVEGPINDVWPPKAQNLMFGDLPLQADAQGHVEVVSQNPDADADRLMRGFMARAYRRPVQAEDVAPFVKLVHTARESGMNFSDAMLTAYSAVLCSPSFVTLQEKPGRLDDHALASRMAYFLWNSEPDAALRTLADRNALQKPGAVRTQAERMLDGPRSHQFVDAFLDYWLDLRKVNDNSPDEFLYPDYYLDDFLVESSRDETQAYFGELIKNNLPARNLVSSNFVMVNERLANLYGIPGVHGVQIRKVMLPANSVRGGLLTQASVLKVTANGTNTSPVIRGNWINERILGYVSPPPPAGVAAVEPDTRGATTIREQLAKHRTDATCNSCHSKIDPAGFALENFDVMGGWRDRYRSLGAGEKVEGRGKNGTAFAFCLAQPVDASGQLPQNGGSFHDVRELKRLLTQDERQIARNLVRQFVTYGTGAPIRFGDRPKIEAILDRAKPSGYGVRSLLYATLESDLFRNK